MAKAGRKVLGNFHKNSQESTARIQRSDNSEISSVSIPTMGPKAGALPNRWFSAGSKRGIQMSPHSLLRGLGP